MTVDLEPQWTALRDGDRTVLSFPQPGALLNMNHRGHWRVRQRVTKQWRVAAHQVALLLGPPSQRVHGPSWVRLVIPVPDRRRRDAANLTPLTKACVDGLVDAGCWPDDTPEYLTTLEPLLRHEPRPKGVVPTVQLVLTPRTPGQVTP